MHHDGLIATVPGLYPGGYVQRHNIYQLKTRHNYYKLPPHLKSQLKPRVELITTAKNRSIIEHRTVV